MSYLIFSNKSLINPLESSDSQTIKYNVLKFKEDYISIPMLIPHNKQIMEGIIVQEL